MGMYDGLVHDAERLAQLQALPLTRKIQITQTRIIEWYQHWNGNVCVSFSGGKDSTVLLHIARQIYPNIKAVFSNTGLEYPEIQKFVKLFDHVDIVTPDLRFNEVVTRYGYPLISKEVSESIYYARRIKNGQENLEASRCRVDLMGERSYSEEEPEELQKRRELLLSGVDMPEQCGPNAYREQLNGAAVMPKQDNKRNWKEERPDWYDFESGKRDRAVLMGFSDEEKNNEDNYYKTGKWKNYHRICLNGDSGNSYDANILYSKGKDGEQTARKSQFNKDRWLPICQELPALMSHYCCAKMKKQPIHRYQTKSGLKPILATRQMKAV